MSLLRSFLGLAGCLLLPAALTAQTPAPAPTPSATPQQVPDLSEPAPGYAFKITVRILGENRTELWTSDYNRKIQPSKPLGFNLKGDDFELMSHFTIVPKTASDFLLVAKSTVQIAVEGKGRLSQNTVQSMPCHLGEKVIFLPLGDRKTGPDAHNLILELTIENLPVEKTDS